MKKLLFMIMLWLVPVLALSQYVEISGNHFVDGSGNTLTVKGVWLEPKEYNWTTWWAQSLSAFQADIDSSFTEIGNISGINLVRTIIDTASIQRSDIIQKFDYLLQKCKTANIYLMPDILGWASIPGMNTSDYIDTTRAMALVNNLVSTYANDTTIFAWEVRHEGLNGFYARSFPVASIDSSMEWYKSIHDSLKGLDGNHLVTTGEDIYTSYHCAETSTTYSLSDIEDFFDFQFYKDPFVWNAQMYGNKAVYGPNSYYPDGYYGVRAFMRSSSGKDMAGKPMLLGEVGYSSGGSSSEQKQFEYYDILGKLINSHQIAGFVFWSIRDRSSSTSSQMYGLFDHTGNIKKVGYWYSGWSLSSEQYDIWK